MKRIFSLLTMVFMLAIPFGAIAADTIAKVKAGGALVVGVRSDAPPFGFMERSTGKLSGYDADYAALLAKKLGVNPLLKPVALGDRLAALAGGKVDLLAANLTKPAGGGGQIEYSDVYLTTGQKLLAKKGMLKAMGDVVGKKIGVVLGTPSETCAKNACPAAMIVPYADYDKALGALEKGEIDAFSSDQAILADILTMLPGGAYEIPPIDLSEESYVLGYAAGDKAFGEFLNKAIAELKADGSAGKLKEKWFSPTSSRPATAYGAVVRKAVTGFRILVVLLDGTMFRDSPVDVFTMEGNRIARGKVVSAIGDEAYIDVDEDAFNLMRPGFLVTMNIEFELARSLALEKGAVLKMVRDNTAKEAAEIRAQAEKDSQARAQADAELKKMREENQMQINLERERYYQLRRLYDNFQFQTR